MPVFKSVMVIDSTTGRPRSDLVGQQVTIVMPGTTNPVSPLTEYASGETVSGAVLTADDDLMLTPFVTPDGVYEVEALAADGTRSFLETSEGARIASQAAAESAAASANESAESAAKAWTPLGTGMFVPPAGSGTPYATMTAAVADATANSAPVGTMAYIEDPES